ncbi:oligosaccharide flippase family protein [Acinetobacter sp. ANC 5380]|uniref:Oligosaccharide flippase family protein n=1 Tax=Acinetobacter terrae TaxID=2731247 RepID=A0A7Y2RE06_9GAMM|nr:oligosaccharide flippase family protein [Acinetobacter terrae]NNH76958.1 oligosaccharide flippase family protein [Acinetobacter terrae]
MTVKSKKLKSRTRILLENSLASLLTRASNILVTLLLVPLSISALGIENYGVVAMILAFSIFFTFTDFGLGSAIVKTIAEVGENKENFVNAVKIISNAWFFLFFISILIILLSIILYNLNIINYIFMAVTILVAINMPFSLYMRILFAMQKNLQSGLWQTSGKILSLLVIYLYYLFGYIDLNNYIYIFFGVPLLLNVIGTLLFFNKCDYYLPQKKFINLKETATVIKTGFLFLILQVIPYIETGIDTIFLSLKYDLEFIGKYDIFSKLFLYIPALISVAAFPLWPAISKAIVEGDLKWVLILKARVYQFFSFLSLISTIFLAFFSENIVLLWTKKEFSIDTSIVLTLAIVCFLYSMSLMQAMFLNGLGLIKEQVKFYSYYIVIMILLKIIVIMNFGVFWMLNFLILAMGIRWFYMEKIISMSIIEKS